MLQAYAISTAAACSIAVGSLVAQQVTGLKTDAWETNVAHDFMGPYREPLTLKVKTHFA